eukprot:11249513-Heterocapsa_arctica.AAC.1
MEPVRPRRVPRPPFEGLALKHQRDDPVASIVSAAVLRSARGGALSLMVDDELSAHLLKQTHLHGEPDEVRIHRLLWEPEPLTKNGGYSQILVKGLEETI